MNVLGRPVPEANNKIPEIVCILWGFHRCLDDADVLESARFSGLRNVRNALRLLGTGYRLGSGLRAKSSGASDDFCLRLGESGSNKWEEHGWLN